MSTRRNARPAIAHSRSRIAALAAIAGTLILAAVACSTSGSDDSAASRPGFAHAQVDGAAQFDAGGVAQGREPAIKASAGSAPELRGIEAAVLARAQIKNAYIGLRSKTIAAAVTSIENAAAAEGGFVDSENTNTNAHGVATSASIDVKVPVDRFEEAVDAVSHLGQLATKRVTTEDVTGKVADVDSRVQSAKDAIDQLRTLYSHATKLSDIITLESELSDRESDLEALQAQQRALTAQTTLSTIDVRISRPPNHVVPASTQEARSGFLGGLQQGWDALVATFAAISHGLGAMLPLALAIGLILAAGWLLLRRLPRRHPDPGAETHG